MLSDLDRELMKKAKDIANTAYSPYSEFNVGAALFLENNKFEGVIAITRGGLVPAAIVARELEIRVVDTLSSISYHDNSAEKLEEKQRETVQIVKAPSYTKTGKNWLIVDDLVDTGETAKAVRALLPKAHFATVYAKPAGRPLVDTFVTEVSQDTWIYFPWDLEPRPVDPISFNNR